MDCETLHGGWYLHLRQLTKPPRKSENFAKHDARERNEWRNSRGRKNLRKCHTKKSVLENGIV
ncbi:hypothetical protein KIN20_027837 [Parelaphostrongylus tenuis]|uniref:Uncharacterized protein n=1 Tax=Parelaphostrongylus tenuis TaxID=148309 RepID=A0AAD5WE70_PARTN|nr:hypothetical protein KIN20_027837 [Parelaphostrongylus tenuis]